MKNRSGTCGKARKTLPLEGGGEISFGNTSKPKRRYKDGLVTNDW
jgi:hypothetical protein